MGRRVVECDKREDKDSDGEMPKISSKREFGERSKGFPRKETVNEASVAFSARKNEPGNGATPGRSVKRLKEYKAEYYM